MNKTYQPFYYIYQARLNPNYNGFTATSPGQNVAHELHFIKLILEFMPSQELLFGMRKITKPWNFADVYNKFKPVEIKEQDILGELGI